MGRDELRSGFGETVVCREADHPETPLPHPGNGHNAHRLQKVSEGEL